MNDFINNIKKEFENSKNTHHAFGMKAYMKNQFEFLGINSPTRRALTQPFLKKDTLPPENQIWPIVRYFWEEPQREYQYFAMEFLSKYHKVTKKNWIVHYETLISNKSWWDTVDYIAVNLVGGYFKKFPEQIFPITGRWMSSGNLWLQRSCVLFQLKYKYDTDTNLLSSFIIPLSESREFFIAKAIGWALREYSKYDPGWVLEFVENNRLQSLSKREAIRRII